MNVANVYAFYILHQDASTISVMILFLVLQKEID